MVPNELYYPACLETNGNLDPDRMQSQVCLKVADSNNVACCRYCFSFNPLLNRPCFNPKPKRPYALSAQRAQRKISGSACSIGSDGRSAGSTNTVVPSRSESLSTNRVGSARRGRVAALHGLIGCSISPSSSSSSRRSHAMNIATAPSPTHSGHILPRTVAPEAYIWSS
jgi:hypothetical protein